MILDMLRDLIHKVAPSVVNNAINEAARAELLQKRVDKMARRSRRKPSGS
jgi:hypothetical protein